jgi:DNA-binding response OmpR family regulator
MPADSASHRIAIVDDDPAVLDSLDFMFSAAGFHVSAYAGAEDAAAASEVAAADCLVIDYALPDGDGLTLIRRLRRQGSTSPAILIVSAPTRLCRRQAREDGVPLMEKPLIDDDLGAWVELLISGRPLKAPEKVRGCDPVARPGGGLPPAS